MHLYTYTHTALAFSLQTKHTGLFGVGGGSACGPASATRATIPVLVMYFSKTVATTFLTDSDSNESSDLVVRANQNVPGKSNYMGLAEQ